MDICQGRNIYFVGIKGAGMAGLAQILKGLGYRVSGSDIADTFFTDAILRRAGIEFYEGFDPRHIPADVDWAVSSGAYLTESSKFKVQSEKLRLKTKNKKQKTPYNPEIAELQKRGVPVVNYPEALAYFFNQSFGIAVTGTHGKSTTTGMIAYILEQARKNPFALVGAELLNWHSNARVPNTDPCSMLHASCFVIEADEYREQFLYYKPNVIVITNIDYDHPDYFATKDDYQQAFEKFKNTLKPEGFVIRHGDFSLPLTPYRLSLIGAHNQQNAALAYETCRRLGIDDKTIRQALASYQGLRRRLERVGEYKGTLLIDDYAHHPAEVEASLKALKEAYPGRRLIVLFHPHTYSRTGMFLKKFASSLTLADELYLLDIYASAREQKGDVSSDDLAEEIALLGHTARNLNNIENAVHYMSAYLNEGDVFVTMGAGDVFRVADQLLEKVKNEK